jgi:short-subunit dehydrogenase
LGINPAPDPIINVASIVGIATEVLNGVYGGTKGFVLAFSQSLQHERADKGIRIQAVVPGAIATDFWEAAGSPLEALPSQIVMQAEDLVTAALAGLDQDELFGIPSLSELAGWQACEAARQTLMPNLSRQEVAARYRHR